MSYFPATQRSVYGQTTVKAGDTISANSVAANTFQTFASSYDLPGNSLVAGLALTFEGNGLFTTTGLGPSTTASVVIGGVEVINTGALNLIAGVANYGYYFKIMIKVTSVGTSGVIRVMGKLDFQSGANPNTITSVLIPSSDKTINTTINNMLALRASWTAATAGNTNTLRDLNIFETRPPKAAN